VELYFHSPICLHGIVNYLKHRDNFTFTFVFIDENKISHLRTLVDLEIIKVTQDDETGFLLPETQVNMMPYVCE
jgi:hypothetical protein